jgi:quercetin dioxygenase-like cupin family protein
MSEIFPEPIRNLPLADVPLDGLKAYLSQAEEHQILFMQFSEDVELPEHSHDSQWGVVLEGKIDFTIDGVFFNQKDRYKAK